MDRIKEALEDVYVEVRFSEQRKNETLQKVHTEKNRLKVKSFLPIGVVCAMFVMILILLQPQQSIEQTTTNDASEPAPYDAVIAMAERAGQFQAILESGVMDDASKMDYLRTSDWQLQLAFEKEASAMYKLPGLSDGEGRSYAELLFYMREYILAGVIHEDVLQAFQAKRNFRELTQLNDVLKPYVQLSYFSVLDEQMPGDKLIGEMPTAVQVTMAIFTILLALSIIYNLLKARHKSLMLLQLILVIVCIIVYTKPNEQLGAIDETTLITSSEEVFDYLGADYERLELLAATTFDQVRFGLFELHGSSMTKYALVKFDRIGNTYLFSEMQWMNDDKVWVTPYYVRSDGQRIMLMALADVHHVSEAHLEVFTNPTYQAIFEIKHNRAQIQAFYLPQVDASFEIKLYDEDGNRVVR